ncbi:MAG: DUF4167 domain-containing protein [Flavobacteriaceae bacterium]
MRQGQQGKRMRGRGGRKGGGSNQANRSYESNGPDVKVRGTAAHIAEKYVQLARDAATSGDPVASENYLQHAEHYFRIVAASQPPEQRMPFPQNADGDNEDDGDEIGGVHGNGHANGHAPGRSDQPSELAASTSETSNEDEGEPMSGDSGAETPQPRRGRGRPRRQNVPKNSASASDEDGAAEASVMRGENASSEASLEV